MRVLLAFIICLFYYSFTISVKGNFPVSKVEQKNVKYNFAAKNINTFSQKTNQNSCRKDYPDFFDRIHQHINHTSDLAIGFTNKLFQLTFHPINIAKNRLLRNNYSYHFIFQCLYPKHTFW